MLCVQLFSKGGQDLHLRASEFWLRALLEQQLSSQLFLIARLG